MNRPRPLTLTATLVAGLAGMLALSAIAQDATTKPAQERRTTPTGLTIIEQGRSDTVVQTGDRVTVHYTGKLENGTVFDTSLKNNGDPFTFTVGVDRVIAGWQEGLIGMHAGDRRQLIIPAALGYGENGSPPRIPPNATLTFDIELLYISRSKS